MSREFDVIVIGAGPVGCYAGLTAARNGCSVAIFEEHSAIGWPRHDPGWLMESDFAESVVGSLGRAVPWSRIDEFRVSHAETGDLVERSTRAGYLIRRDLMEKEIAAQAVRAGAALFLRTKVSNLLKGDGKVEGVETNSSLIPTARGKIVICADGIRSAGNGFAASEKLCEGRQVGPGISFLLANAEVSPRVVEIPLSSDPLLNYRSFFIHGNGLCFFNTPSLDAFHGLQQRRDNAVSRKIRSAYPVEIVGFARTFSGKYGEYFKELVKGNVLFAGDASGGAGTIHGMIQAQFAGSVAASAIRENDTSPARLSEYRELVMSTLGKAPFFYFSAREDFGTFERWFREFEAAAAGIRATELSPQG